MQNDARRQELIRAKLQELKDLENEPIAIESDPRDLYEEDEPVVVEQELPPQPQEKVYDLDQVVVLMWCETINSILQEIPMSEYKAIRLASVRNKLLYEMDLTEFIPRPQQSQEPIEQEQPIPVQKPKVPDVIDLGDDPAEPKFDGEEKSLDMISQKLRDIESKKEAAQQEQVQQPQQVEAEQSGIQKLIGNITGANKKKVEPHDVIDDRNKPMSMG